MAKTKIEWCHYTFNPWIGCTRVSPGCEHCYAEAQVRRAPNLILGKGPHPLLGRDERLWGVMSPRRVTSEAYWKQPLRWNKAAERDGERHRVFCASMADVFEDWKGEPSADFEVRPSPRDLDEIRDDLWTLIEHTPWLDWLLLTKRPQNILSMVPKRWKSNPSFPDLWPRNAWVGCTVEDQKRAEERLDHLTPIPAPVLFVSYEPALEAVDFRRWLCGRRSIPGVISPSVGFQVTNRIGWLIVGGESGPGARPFDLAWARQAVNKCKAAGVPVFVKQLGAQPVQSGEDAIRHGSIIGMRDRKGGDMDEWPADLRIREFPAVGLR